MFCIMQVPFFRYIFFVVHKVSKFQNFVLASLDKILSQSAGFAAASDAARVSVVIGIFKV